MITFESSGNFAKTERFLAYMQKNDIRKILDSYGRQGVAALRSATPVESGETAAAWDFTVSGGRGGWSISWTNSHMAGKTPVAILLQYGHGTGTGGYVSGRDYINPAIRPVFDKIADGVWKAVTSA